MPENLGPNNRLWSSVGGVVAYFVAPVLGEALKPIIGSSGQKLFERVSEKAADKALEHGNEAFADLLGRRHPGLESVYREAFLRTLNAIHSSPSPSVGLGSMDQYRDWFENWHACFLSNEVLEIAAITPQAPDPVQESSEARARLRTCMEVLDARGNALRTQNEKENRNQPPSIATNNIHTRKLPDELLNELQIRIPEMFTKNLHELLSDARNQGAMNEYELGFIERFEAVYGREIFRIQRMVTELVENTDRPEIANPGGSAFQPKSHGVHDSETTELIALLNNPAFGSLLVVSGNPGSGAVQVAKTAIATLDAFKVSVNLRSMARDAFWGRFAQELVLLRNLANALGPNRTLQFDTAWSNYQRCFSTTSHLRTMVDNSGYGSVRHSLQALARGGCPQHHDLDPMIVLKRVLSVDDDIDLVLRPRQRLLKALSEDLAGLGKSRLLFHLHDIDPASEPSLVSLLCEFAETSPEAARLQIVVSVEARPTAYSTLRKLPTFHVPMPPTSAVLRHIQGHDSNDPAALDDLTVRLSFCSVEVADFLRARPCLSTALGTLETRQSGLPVTTPADAWLLIALAYTPQLLAQLFAITEQGARLVAEEIPDEADGGRRLPIDIAGTIINAFSDSSVQKMNTILENHFNNEATADCNNKSIPNLTEIGTVYHKAWGSADLTFIDVSLLQHCRTSLLFCTDLRTSLKRLLSIALLSDDVAQGVSERLRVIDKIEDGWAHDQQHRLEEILSHALMKSPYYKRIATKLDIAPHHGLSYFESLPLLTRATYSANIEDMKVEVPETCYRDRTSGTSGRPIDVFRDSRSLFFESLRFHDLLRYYMADAVRLGKGLIAALYVSHYKTSSEHLYEDPLLEQSMIVKLRCDTGSIWDRLADMGLTVEGRAYVLTGSVSSLIQLANNEVTRRDLPDPAAILPSGEVLLPSARMLLEEAFGAPVFELYSMREFGTVAFQCRCSEALHIQADWFLAEATNSEGKAVQAGDRGELIISDLSNHHVPMLRYATGDSASLEWKRCGCGLCLPLLTGFTGRKSVCFAARNGTLIDTADFAKRVERLPLIWYRVTQAADNTVDFDFASNEDAFDRIWGIL
jgi:phenylacetate-CoA ligase